MGKFPAIGFKETKRQVEENSIAFAEEVNQGFDSLRSEPAR